MHGSGHGAGDGHHGGVPPFLMGYAMGQDVARRGELQRLRALESAVLADLDRIEEALGEPWYEARNLLG